MNHWILLAISIACEIFATTMLKQSEGFNKLLPTFIAIVAYTIAFYLVARVFQVLPMGIVYAIWPGVGIVATALIGWFAFGQKPDLAATLGITMIVGGIIIINLFSKTGH